MDRISNAEIKSKIVEIANKYSFKSIISELEAYKKKEYETKVAFLGEFSSGKTSLANALMKKKFLPTFDKPTTAVVTEIRKGKETKIEVVSYEEDEVSYEIEPSELAVEVQKTQLNSKIRISISSSDLIDDNTVLIDTPGVSSLNEAHSDVTFGYLPNVDVAFVVININMGSVSETLLKFISQYPESVKSRIRFVLSHVDTKSENEVQKIKTEFQEALSAVVNQPEIFLVSSKVALEANNNNDAQKYAESGVLAIESIIKNDIPSYKREIANEREREYFLAQVQKLIIGLDELYVAMNLDTSALEKEKQSLIDERTALRKEMISLKKKVEKKEDDIKTVVKGLANDYGLKILDAAVANRDEEVNILASNYVEELQEIIVNDLRGLDFFNPQASLKGLVGTISSSLNTQLIRAIKVTDTVVGLANHAIVAAIAPAVGLAGNAAEMGASAFVKSAVAKAGSSTGKKLLAVAAQTAMNSAITQSTNGQDLGVDEEVQLTKGQQVGAFAASIMTQFDVLGKVSKFVMSASMKQKSISTLLYPANRQITAMFESLRDELEQVVESQFVLPLKVKEEALDLLSEHEDRDKIEFDQEKETLKLDIQKLKAL